MTGGLAPSEMRSRVLRGLSGRAAFPAILKDKDRQKKAHPNVSHAGLLRSQSCCDPRLSPAQFTLIFLVVDLDKSMQRGQEIP